MRQAITEIHSQAVSCRRVEKEFGSGDNRAPWQKLVALRISKAIPLGGTRRLELISNVNNILQNQAYQTYVTLNYFNPQFARPAAWIEPRNFNVMTKLTW